jgi:hypothetical protein
MNPFNAPQQIGVNGKAWDDDDRPWLCWVWKELAKLRYKVALELRKALTLFVGAEEKLGVDAV